MNFSETRFAQAHPASLTGKMRVLPEDFIVDELMEIDLSGNGEHLWLQVRKTGANTDWVATQLARCANVPAKEVGYAGLKDRHAVTTQWFSVQLPGKADPDFSALPDEIEVLEQTRHAQKLRRGALTGNRFTLTLRECEGDLDAAQAAFQQIGQRGMPNYFGEQRFGHNFGNLDKALRWFGGNFEPRQRNQRSLYLSAARSWIFNHILSQRVQQGTWGQRLAGDVFILDSSNSWFVDDAGAELQTRLDTFDIHPSGAQWGRGALPSQHEMLALETAQAALFPDFCAGLERQGLKQERRALRVRVADTGFEVLDGRTIRLTFTLPAGAYATVLLEQLGAFA